MGGILFKYFVQKYKFKIFKGYWKLNNSTSIFQWFTIIKNDSKKLLLFQKVV